MHCPVTALFSNMAESGNLARILARAEFQPDLGKWLEFSKQP